MVFTPSNLFLQGLDRPKFAETDPQVITEGVIATTEALLGRKLYPAQVERLLANLQAFRESEVRYDIQHTGEQMLVALAEGVTLDYLGQPYGVYRLSGASSETTLRFTYDAIGLPESSIVIDQGTLASINRATFDLQWATQHGAVIRGTDEGGHDAFDADGNPYVDVPATCNVTGTLSNGFVPGEINTLVNPIANITVTNTVQTKQGGPAESDERFRERILLGPFKRSGGHPNAYIEAAREVSSSISDVGLFQPSPGKINVYPLTSDGVPGAGLLLQVARALTPESMNRPASDDVAVLPPVEIAYQVVARVTPYRGAAVGAVKTEAERRIGLYRQERQPKVGRDIVPSQIIDAVMNVQGVYRCTIDEPSYRKLEQFEWANLTQITVIMEAAEDG